MDKYEERIQNLLDKENLDYKVVGRKDCFIVLKHEKCRKYSCYTFE